MPDSKPTTSNRRFRNACRAIFGTLLLTYIVLLPFDVGASTPISCSRAIAPSESSHSLGINWTPHAGSKVYETPEVFTDPYVVRALKDDKFREYLVNEIKQGRAVITDYKQIADAEPLYQKGTKPTWPAGFPEKATPEDLTFPQLVEYITTNYKLANGTSGQALFSEQEKKIYHPLMPELARQGLAPKFQSLSARPSLVEAAVAKIHDTWEALLRYTPHETRTTLLPLPNKYVVAGGRFRESYYWDTLWIMKGLIESGYRSTARGMLENFVFLFEQHGIIPNGNRFYYLTRTQVPVFMEMVSFLESQGVLNFANYTLKNPSSLEARVLNVAENYFNKIWKGTDRFHKETGLFKYSDDAGGSVDPKKVVIRPESGILEPRAHEFHSQRTYAESGWDMSYSRFGHDPQNWLPVELNFLLMNYTKKLSDLFEKVGQPEKAQKYLAESKRIQNQINQHMFEEKSGLFVDFHTSRKQTSKVITAASFFAFYTEAYPKNQESQNRLKELLAELKPEGHLGVHTTNQPGAGQWDGAWSWAPLNEIAFQSLLKYGLNREATELAFDYSTMVLTSFHKNKNVYFEKYHGKDGSIDLPKDTEIYGNEEGFGWTNGTLAVFLKYLNKEGALPELEKEVRRRLKAQ